MKYRTLGRTGLRVSEIGFGALEIGRSWGMAAGGTANPPTEQEAISVIHKAIDLGITFFDTAPAYQMSEERLGKALVGKRDKIVLATKCGEWFDVSSVYDYSTKGTEKFVEKSLINLRTNVLDLVQIHSGTLDVVRNNEAYEGLRKARDAGKIRYIGISVDDNETAIAAIKHGGFDTVQPSYHMLRRGIEPEVLPLAMKNNIGIIIKDPVYRGRLTSKYVYLEESAEKSVITQLDTTARSYGMTLTQLALRFILTHDAVSTIIAGTKRAEHLEENVQASDGKKMEETLHRRIRELLHTIP